MNQPKTEFEVLQQMMNDQIAGVKDPQHEIHQRLRKSLKKDAEELKNREAFRDTEGIVEHEFSEKIVKKCEPELLEMVERLATGQTTFEEEDARLLKLWKASKDIEQ